jgi:predicted pyridoxine 5'-phosphate oxidase superfamily flavin-nucleotide-binding protein
MDKETLSKMTVSQLREEAKKIPGVKGISSMKKDDLVELLTGTAGTPPSAAPKKPTGPTKPLDRAEIKKRIKALKEEKRTAISNQDRNAARLCNRQIHAFKRQLRRLARERATKGA